MPKLEDTTKKDPSLKAKSKAAPVIKPKLRHGVKKVELGVVALSPTRVGFEFGEAVGLAMRGLDRKTFSKDPVIEPLDDKQIKYAGAQSEDEFEPTAIKETNFDDDIQVFEIDIPNKAKNKRKRIIVELSMLFFLAVLLGGLLIAYPKLQANEDHKGIVLKEFKQTQSIIMHLPLMINSDKYSADKVKGRLVEQTIEQAKDIDSIYTESKSNVSQGLTPGEKVWLEPLNQAELQGSIVFPMKIKWLIYSYNDVQKIAITKINQNNVNNEEYILDKLEVTKLYKTEKPELYYLQVAINISLDNPIDISNLMDDLVSNVNNFMNTAIIPSAQASASSLIVTSNSDYVIVKDQDPKWQNIRQGPSETYPVIGMVYANEMFEVLEQNGEWLRIAVKGNNQAWINYRYVDKVD